MDEASNRRHLTGYLQAAEKRPIQALCEVNDVEPAIAPARSATAPARIGRSPCSETGGSIGNRLLWKNLFPRNGNIPSLLRVYTARHQRAGDHRHLSPCQE